MMDGAWCGPGLSNDIPMFYDHTQTQQWNRIYFWNLLDVAAAVAVVAGVDLLEGRMDFLPFVVADTSLPL